MPEPTLRARALALYSPPFRFEKGYIWDSNNEMVADDKGEDGKSALALRVRGWGRISYLPDAPALQDEAGKLIAEALTAFWEDEAFDAELEGSPQFQQAVATALDQPATRQITSPTEAE